MYYLDPATEDAAVASGMRGMGGMGGMGGGVGGAMGGKKGNRHLLVLSDRHCYLCVYLFIVDYCCHYYYY